MKVFFPNPETGGAALEYIVVSVFGLLLAIASIAFVGNAAKQKLGVIEQQLGIELNSGRAEPLRLRQFDGTSLGSHTARADGWRRALELGQFIQVYAQYDRITPQITS